MSPNPSSRIESLEQKLAADPSSKIFLPLAEQYRLQGALDRALETLAAGLERNPRYHAARVALGRVLIEQGRVDEGRRELTRALAEVPDNILASRLLEEAGGPLEPESEPDPGSEPESGLDEGTESDPGEVTGLAAAPTPEALAEPEQDANPEPQPEQEHVREQSLELSVEAEQDAEESLALAPDPEPESVPLSQELGGVEVVWCPDEAPAADDEAATDKDAEPGGSPVEGVAVASDESGGEELRTAGAADVDVEGEVDAGDDAWAASESALGDPPVPEPGVWKASDDEPQAPGPEEESAPWETQQLSLSSASELESEPEAASPPWDPDPEPEMASPAAEPDPEPEMASPDAEPDPEIEPAMLAAELDPEPVDLAPELDPESEPVSLAGDPASDPVSPDPEPADGDPVSHAPEVASGDAASDDSDFSATAADITAGDTGSAAVDAAGSGDVTSEQDGGDAAGETQEAATEIETTPLQAAAFEPGEPEEAVEPADAPLGASEDLATDPEPETEGEPLSAGPVSVSDEQEADRTLNLARLYRRQGRLDLAADVYRQLLDADPDHMSARRELEELCGENVPEITDEDLVPDGAVVPEGVQVASAESLEDARQRKIAFLRAWLEHIRAQD